MKLERKTRDIKDTIKIAIENGMVIKKPDVEKENLFGIKVRRASDKVSERELLINGR